MKLVELAHAADLAVEDFAELTRMFTSSAVDSLAVIESLVADAVGDTRRNGESGLAPVRREAHEIRGAALNLGFTRAAELAGALEEGTENELDTLQRTTATLRSEIDAVIAMLENTDHSQSRE